MELPKVPIGERLKTIRQSRNLTLDEVSKITSVSKPMLGQIEREQSSPTFNTLLKIATGMKVPLSYFMESNDFNYKIADIKDIKPTLEENGNMRIFTLIPYDPIKNFEMFCIEIDPGCAHESQPHKNEECVFVMEGKMELRLIEETIILEKNQIIRFQANINHSYSNPYNEKCAIQSILFYPNSIK